MTQRHRHDNVLAALTLTQAHLAGEVTAYDRLMSNHEPQDLIAGLVDLVALVGKVAASDAPGRGVNDLLDAAFSTIADPGAPAAT